MPQKLDTIDEVFISATVIGELYYGAYKSNDVVKHIDQVQAFINNCRLLEVDKTTANTYGNIKAKLAKKGKPIPENDIWIGAIALQHNLPLYTTDAHFKEIDGITLL